MTSVQVLQNKIDTLRAVEAERKFGNVIAVGSARESIPDLPAGAVEVFSLFDRLEGINFLFKPPRSIRDLQTWEQRLTDESALGEALVLGTEIFSAPEFLPGESEEDDLPYGGAPIRMSVADGRVYYIDPEDYISLYKNPDARGVVIEIFAEDPISFFDRYVLGPEYPRMVATVIGERVANDRNPRTGEYADSWRRLLIAAELAE